MSPNQLTAMSLLFVLAAVAVMVCFGFGSIVASVVVALLALAYVLDCADGQLARTSGQCSKFGAWFDHVSDTAKVFIIHGGIGWLLLRSIGVHGISLEWSFLAVLIHLSGSVIYFFAWTYKVMLMGKHLIAKEVSESKKSLVSRGQMLLQCTDHGWLILIFVFLYDPVIFSWVYLGYGVLTFVIFMAYVLMSGLVMAKSENSL